MSAQERLEELMERANRSEVALNDAYECPRCGRSIPGVTFERDVEPPAFLGDRHHPGPWLALTGCCQSPLTVEQAEEALMGGPARQEERRG